MGREPWRSPKWIEPRWTDRQVEVLDLIVRGYTNREVAAELGITFGGAKWHVSEVLMKRGVMSRAAAAYWRWRGSRGRRVTQWVRGFTGLAFGKVGAMAVLAAGLAAWSLGIAVTLAPGEGSLDDAPAAESATPSVPSGKLVFTAPATPTVEPVLEGQLHLAYDQVGDVYAFLTKFETKEYTSRFRIVFVMPEDLELNLEELADQFDVYGPDRLHGSVQPAEFIFRPGPPLDAGTSSPYLGEENAATLDGTFATVLGMWTAEAFFYRGSLCF